MGWEAPAGATGPAGASGRGSAFRARLLSSFNKNRAQIGHLHREAKTSPRKALRIRSQRLIENSWISALERAGLLS